MKKKMDKKGIATVYIIIFIILVLLFVGYAMYDKYSKSIPKNQVYNPNPSKTTTASNKTTSNVKITSRTYPNGNLTPGDILTTDMNFVCVEGYSTRMRNVPESLKKEVYKKYKLTYPPKKNTYITDHYIPLELGGSNDIKNLWPQPYADSLKKDKVENYLATIVCNRTINMTYAQEQIKNWTAVYAECCAK